MANAAPPIQSGKILPGVKTVGYKLHKNEGKRFYSESVKFHKSFPVPPKVFVSLCMEDILTGYEHKIKVVATNIDEEGFSLNFETWDDGKIWSAGATWLAVSEKLFQDKHAAMGIAQFDEDTVDDYPLNEGADSRYAKAAIKFPAQFSGSPMMLSGFSSIDTDNRYDCRISSTIKDLSSNGFNLQISTWGDSRVRAASVSWVAFDPIYNQPHEHLQIQQGDPVVKKNKTPGYTLFDKQGSRFCKETIRFQSPFAREPSVLTCLNHLDVFKDHDLRAAVVGDNVAAHCFDLKFSTWNDSRVWSVGSAWLAFTYHVPPPPKPQAPPQEKKEAGNNVADDDDETNECKICFSSKINTVFIPCGHMSSCEQCAKKVTQKKFKCPICNADIQHVQKIFLV
ncbi:hypothetical protein PROFUN_02965 [Planoprotostelium fungivorum]|uniref:RING-type domain-containing protein n=1 Tax=Planoprotostelium fungivorum TaxID=1890364 RepID=A0A2P6NX58_9EUKA|nr:hypothetical protein PROFUN_02965 [Planoprotostelium fungivorum]